MTVTKTVNLLLRSSDSCPYSGKLDRRNNYIAAIELAELLRDFAERGCHEEAMNLDVAHWDKAISRLKIHPIVTGPIFKKIK